MPSKRLRFLYWIGNPSTLGAERFIYMGWKHAILTSGHFFYELTNEHQDWEKRIQQTDPDIIFLTNFSNLEKTAPILSNARRRGIFVFHVVDMPYPESYLQAIRTYDPADIYFGEREPDSMAAFTAATGKSYTLIPNAADRLLHYPIPPVDRYAFDVVFLGNKRTKKSHIFEELLLPLWHEQKYRVGLFGPFWTKHDFVLAGIQKLFYKIGLNAASRFISNIRITVPFDQENALYSSAKISLNFHEREADGSQPHHIVNQRAYKIPASGGFQICDRVQAMPKYFKENDEIVLADDAQEFRSKIEYFLHNDDERERIRKQSIERAHAEHTYHHRVNRVIQLFRGSCPTSET